MVLFTRAFHSYLIYCIWCSDDNSVLKFDVEATYSRRPTTVFFYQSDAMTCTVVYWDLKVIPCSFFQCHN